MGRHARRPSGSLLARLGRTTARHPWRFLIAWLLVTLLGFGLAGGAVGDSLFSRLFSGASSISGQDETGRELLAGAGQMEASTYSLIAEGVDLEDPDTAQAATRVVERLADLPQVEAVVNPFTVPQGPTTAQAAPFIAQGEPPGFLTVVTFDSDASAEDIATARETIDPAFDDLISDTGATQSHRGGVQQLIDAIVGQMQTDLKVGEGVAIPITFVVMVFVFGGFVAAGLPVAGAIASIAGALGVLLGFSYLIDLDATVVNVVTVLGLGLCIDYGLLVVSRFREELRSLARGIPVDQITPDQIERAASATLDRAGRTVVFSALTIAISLGGLMVFEAEILKAIGSAGVSVVILALAVAISLVPALCVLGARRLLRRGTDVSPDDGLFSRLAHGVVRRPWVVIVGVLALLIVAALPVLDLRMTSSGPDMLRDGHPQREFFTTFAEDYPALTSPDLTVVATGVGKVAFEKWSATAAELPGVVSVGAPEQLGDVRYVDLRTDGDPLGDNARALNDLLRAEPPPFESYVVGQASFLADYVDGMWDRAPYAGGLVVLASFVLLFLMTGSFVIPVKALLMNVLSLGASLGIVVWIFQEGHLEWLLRFDSPGGIEETIPLLVLAFGFGLSMDYEVFLLSRIVELHEQGRDNNTAVALGLQRSGRIITSAAILMVIVFSGFVASRVLVIQETGVALVLAVLIDATVVRMLLVPATMAVLGDWNWWAPARMKRLHARYGITE